MAHAAIKVIRPFVRVTSAVSPGPVGRLAFRLFSQAPPRRRKGEASPAVQRAHDLYRQAVVRQVTHGCGYVRAATFEPAGSRRGSVLLVHGWGGEGASMACFAGPLVARGFRVIAFDLPGHGGSSGRRLTIPLGVEAIEAVTRGERPLSGIVGHSFGAAVAAAAIAGGVLAFRPIAAERFVMVAAPNAMKPYGDAFTDALGLGDRARRAFESEVLAIAGRPVESFVNADYLARSGVATLVMHAPDDKEVPFADAELLAGAGPHVTLRPMPGLGHRRILFAEAVHEAAADFIAG